MKNDGQCLIPSFPKSTYGHSTNAFGGLLKPAGSQQS
ncbi:hypothetical protein T265_15883, partial [Opisthorchis viverrini]